MSRLIPSPRSERARGRSGLSCARIGIITLLVCAQWLAGDAAAQVLPLAFNQNIFLYNTNTVVTTNRQPGINWQSQRGVPISTNALDAGSDGRAPTPAQQASYNLPAVATSSNQFRGFVTFGAVPVAGNVLALNSNVSFAQNVVGLNWPIQKDAQQNVLIVLRASQVGAPYLVKQASFKFGEFLPPPNVTEYGTTNGANANYWFPAPYATSYGTNPGAYYSTSAKRVFATQPGVVTLVWQKVVPTPLAAATNVTSVGYVTIGQNIYTLYTNTYLVTGEAAQTPQKMYWTEGTRTTFGHPVVVPAAVQVKFVFNSSFTQNTGTNSDTAPNVNPYYTNSTLWIDGNHQIRADNLTGRAFAELTGPNNPDGSTPFLGFEIVDVFSDPIPTDINVALGKRIPSNGDGSIDPQLAVSPISGTTAFYYQQSISANRVLYAVRETFNTNDFQAYWLITGTGGIQWPYLFNRYREYWPSDPAEYVNYVRPFAATDAEAAQTAVQLPAGEAPSIAYQDDPDHPRAILYSSGLFHTFLDVAHPAHRTLLQFLSGNNVTYERVFSWLDYGLKTNSLFNNSIAVTNLISWNPTNKNLTFPSVAAGPSYITNTAIVGVTLLAPSQELGSTNGSSYVAGYIIQTNGNSFNPTAYLDPFVVGFDQAASGAIIPVNAIPGSNTLEVLWFRSDANAADASLGFKPSYWPAVLGHYNLQWPTTSQEIIMANNKGSGTLDSLQAKGGIYRQPDRSKPGYNPNEEHAVLLGGTAYALQDDLNKTNAGGSYTSDPFVLIDYTGADGRPAMATFKVRREAPEKGALFDYPVAAATILQAPMPLPLLEPPIEGSGAGAINYNNAPSGTSSDLPAVWNNNLANGPSGYYAGFTFQDRKHNFWVYRGLNGGLPTLQVGAYDVTNNVFNNLPDARAVLNQPFTYYIHVSRRLDSLSMTISNQPAGLSLVTTNGFAITGNPTAVGTNLVSVVTSDGDDGTVVVRTFSIGVVTNGPVLTVGPLAITSTNKYSRTNVTYVGRPPFLAQAPATSNSFTMRFYYKNRADFDWPNLSSPLAVGAIVPYLLPVDSLDNPANKSAASLDIVYRPFWPSVINGNYIPKLYSGQTLTLGTAGLTAVRDQSSVELLYQQSIATNTGGFSDTYGSATLFDPTAQKKSNLPANGLPKGLPKGVLAASYQGLTYFPKLPPNLAERIWLDPDSTNLVFQGQFLTPGTGDSYLLLNVLSGSDLAAVQGLCPVDDPDYTSWLGAVANLSASVFTYHEAPNIPGSWVVDTGKTLTKLASDLVVVNNSNQRVDSYAMSASGPGLGYVSYIIGNSGNPDHASEPVTVAIARVTAPLVTGQLIYQPDPNPLSEVISFQHTLDLAGKTSNYEYDWRIIPPVNGLPPTSDPTNWTRLTPVGNDIAHFTLDSGAGIQSLSDNYVSLRYRETDSSANPANTNWSSWTPPVLAEGYIKRVLAGINPFNQRTKDLFNNPVNTTASLITQAGHRWEGDVALNASTIGNSGLIEIYETLLHRGEALSINGSPGVNYGPANDALLLVTGYLNDLYNLVASDALADAANPTIGIGTSDRTYGSIATALFAFKGQEPSLLEEDLALLRGRDDSLAPGVGLKPVYNRLYWNYTRGINAGEVIYALNYNVLDKNNDGVVSAADAAIQFPMGHGDAYGHYLTALGYYYSLLANPNFDWVPQIEAVSILGAAVSVDYQDERKFAASAAALARTGLQVFDLTWRRDYRPGTSGGWNYFAATNASGNTYVAGNVTRPVTRYWGMDHWAARAAQGAYLNWVVGNAILPDHDPDPSHRGSIQQVDRTTVPELKELPLTASQLQTDMNNAEAGFTPLNLSQDAIAFDIDPLQVTGPNPQPHFEQVYKRATTALNNAVVAFNDAQNVTQLMRAEEDSLANLQYSNTNQELTYINQLIELYGTPYPDDIGGSGFYPQGYSGPDIVHYSYVQNPDTNTYGGILEDPKVSKTYLLDLQKLPDDWTGYNYTDFNFIVKSSDPGYVNVNNTYSVPFNVGPDGFFDRPANWTSQRRSPGRIQQSISTLIAAIHELRQAVANAKSDKESLDEAIGVFNAQIAANASVNKLGNQSLDLQTQINDITAAYNIAGKWIQGGETIAQDIATTVVSTIPTTFIAGFAFGSDIGKIAGGTAYGIAVAAKWILMAADNAAFTAFQVALAKKQQTINDNAKLIANSQLDTDTKNAVLSLGAQLGSLQGDLLTINQKLRSVNDANEAYRALVAKGLRIQNERQTYRQHAAALVQGFRTRDAAFRIFQNEKLERYKTLFDLAAKYSFLAAQAYDYETGLLGPKSAAGQTFMNRIISSQALGVVNNGQPQYAGSSTGDPGLSSALAEMKADWDVLKGRLGFNNPDGYGTTVSLRTEKFRVLSGANGDGAWQQVLQGGRVPDLRADADVKRNCLQIENGSGLPVPGIILTFSTTISDGLNLFGNQLAPGDHNFSSSSFATKIFASGVCLDGYIGMDNPSAAGGTSPADPTLDPNALAATPYVYLIPVGQDSMRSPPLGDSSAIRSWNVDDVTIPLPFNISAADFSSTPFYTSASSLSEPLFAVRAHQAFRPVSTTTVFNTSIYGANGALQPSQYTNKRLIGRSIWNSQWKLVIPGRNLLADPNQGLDRFIMSVRDVKLYFITYSYAGN